MTLLGKTETTQQSGDNSININTGGDVAISCNGLSYRDVRDIVDDMLRDRFNQLSHIAREEAQKAVHAFLEKYLPELPQDKFHRFQEPKMQMFLHDVFSASFESNGDEDVEKILFNALKANLDDVDRQKNAVIRRAIQVLPQLSQIDIDYLSFMFCILGIQLECETRQSVIQKLRSLLRPFYSYDFLKEDFVAMLQYTACLSPMAGGGKYYDLGVYFIRKSPHIFAYNFSNEFRNFLHTHSFLNDVIECDSRNPHQFTVNMTHGQLVSEFDKQGYPWEDGALFFSLLGKSCPDEQKTSFIQEIGPEVWRFAEKWNSGIYDHSALQLSPLGKALALFNFKAKIKDFEDVKFTI